MSEELSDLITQFRTYQPIGDLPRPRALDFVVDYTQFVDTLENINAMIGLEKVKEQIATQVKGFVVNYRRYNKPTNKEKLHTLLFGPPGCGKTQLGRYLAELWTTSGCLPEPDGTPLFPSRAQSGQGIQVTGIAKVDNEKVSLRQNLAIREAQLRQMQDRTRNIQVQVNDIITSFNNIRKKVKAKKTEQEGYIQSKFQELKRKIRIINSPASQTNLNGSSPPQILPVVIPKTPGGKSLFGSVIPPILPRVPSDIMKDLSTSKERSKAKFSVVTRGDLIGKYQGHTTDQVRNILQDHVGGVLMIDEAYDLVTSGQDDYGREILTEIINFMTTWPDKIIFIFAGYRKQMEETILNFQPGLARRFNWNFEITEYSPQELCKIFQQQLQINSWTLSEEDAKKTDEFFVNNQNKFPHFGGDTEKLCFFVKETYYKNKWQFALDDKLPEEEFRKIFDTTVDFSIIKEAFEKYLVNSIKEKENKRKEEEFERVRYMYS